MVSFDYSGLDAALMAACIVLYALVAAVVMLAVGWLTQRLQRKWLLSTRNWLGCSLGISTVFLLAFVAVESCMLWRGARAESYLLLWPLVWLSLAVAAFVGWRRSVGQAPVG
jgi:uncharacterized membrane protein